MCEASTLEIGAVNETTDSHLRRKDEALDFDFSARRSVPDRL